MASRSALTLVRAQLVQRLKMGGEVRAAHGAPNVARAAVVGRHHQAAIHGDREAAHRCRCQTGCSRDRVQIHVQVDDQGVQNRQSVGFNAEATACISTAVASSQAPAVREGNYAPVPTSGTSSQLQALAVRSHTRILPCWSPGVAGEG